ncbi:MAG: hypothetical protein IJC02_07045 [Lachnospiraceae bacterium]|nr:hypothetical protein [Lachnospiraceae bacterium]
MDKKVKRLFEEAQQQMFIEEERKKSGIANVVHSADLKQKKTWAGRWNVFWNQSRYMDKTILWIQLLAEAMVAFLFCVFCTLEVPRQDMIAYIIVCSGMLGVLLPAALHRSFASNMAELSETCYFNTKQMVVLQMIYFGISSLVFITIGIILVGVKWQIPLVQISLYGLVPFVLSGCCCLGALMTKNGRRNSYTFVGTTIFLGMFYMTLVSNSWICDSTVLFLWGILLLVGIFLFAIQLALLFRYIDKGEILCMN